MPSPAVSERNATRYILIAIALVAVAALLWVIRDALVIGFGGIVVATLLRAAAMPLSRRTRLSPRWCVVLVVLTLAAGFGLLGWLFGAQVAHQFAQFREQIPAAIENVRNWLAGIPGAEPIAEALKGGSAGGDILSNFGLAATAVLGGLGNLLLILFAGIYFAVDPGMYVAGALRLLPPSRRPQVRRALEDAGTALRNWLVAQLIVMLVVGVVTGVGLALLDVPLSLLLGVLIGLLEFVPVIGPIVAAAPGVLLAFTKGPATAACAALLYIAVQQIESNLLTPLIQRWAVELPPVVALLSIVACGLVFGPLGVLFATPMAVAVMALVQHLYVEDTLEKGRPAGSPSEHPKKLASRT